ncbi:hypothetical protein JXA12_00605 [Candidatus Woesearchaeota archaeon]|nr:hypothetical protein [Candidatus Woesearchaeota archaeon]
MGGKTFVTILWLLLAQALAAILMGMLTGLVAVEYAVSFVFILAAAAYLATRRPRRTLVPLLAFAFGFLHVVYLSFHAVTLWLVVILCLDAVGFILAIDQLGPRRPRRPHPVHARKEILERELPRREPVKVTVYEQEQPKKPKKKAAKKKTAAPKKASRRKAAGKRMPKKKLTRRKAVKKQ